MRNHFRPPTTPLAHPANLVIGPAYRITVLNTGLLRLEYAASGEFEDRASQAVVNRAFPPCEFALTETDDLLEISTDRLHLIYDKQQFSAEGLSVQAKGHFRSSDSLWRYGVPLPNLGGTARTLDMADGAVPLGDGVLARDGVAVVDDSGSVLRTDDGWIAPRRPGNLDVYVFAFGRDYRQALRALYELTGSQPLLPRYALGNWWSRYHPYTAEEYLQLMDRFRAEHVPLSVAVIDMDWHPVDIDPEYGTGWTGYSWNTKLFPDPKAFLGELHDRGLHTALNVHPAEGVHAHEDAYPRIAARLGIDPTTGSPVNFDLTNPVFVEAYFEELHHPQEEAGVDFWWLDWQQGGVTKIPGLDPMWLLNHFHFLDSGRDGSRPLTFSRYAGIGSHRYPIGFSGDTHITWESLDFQPYFTSTASNVGYGWWSHDIGGHFFGYKDDQLVTRWVQFGVFSPIMRLHSGLSPFNSKEPWRFNETTERVMGDFLRLRQRLLPYLYTMNERAHTAGLPLVQPMYYDHPWQEAAYEVANQFMFGSELLVAPITSPTDPATQLGRVKAWLPEGEWIDFFTGLVYRGGRTIYLHRGIDTIPVLAPAGAIVPLLPADAIGAGTGIPPELEVRFYAGADGDFTLAEDNDDERWARTRFTYSTVDREIVIHPAEGHRATLPARRDYHLVLCGFAGIEAVDVIAEGATTRPGLLDGPVPGSLRIVISGRSPEAPVRVRLRGDLTLASNDVDHHLFALLDRANITFAAKTAIYDLVRGAESAELAALALLALDLSPQLLSAVGEHLLARPTDAA